MKRFSRAPRALTAPPPRTTLLAASLLGVWALGASGLAAAEPAAEGAARMSALVQAQGPGTPPAEVPSKNPPTGAPLPSPAPMPAPAPAAPAPASAPEPAAPPEKAEAPPEASEDTDLVLACKTRALTLLRQKSPEIEDIFIDMDGLTVAKAELAVGDVRIRTVMMGEAYIQRDRSDLIHRFLCLTGEKGEVLLTFFTER